MTIAIRKSRFSATPVKTYSNKPNKAATLLADNNLDFPDHPIPTPSSPINQDLDVLMSQIQYQLKKKTELNQQTIQHDLQQVVKDTASAMSSKMSEIRREVEVKLVDMKKELESLQRIRAEQLKTISQEYQKFQNTMEIAIGQVNAGESKINDLRNRFVAELIMFNRNFEISEEKLQGIFQIAIDDAKTRF